MSLDVYLNDLRVVAVFEANITHNLNKMAEKAGIYKHLWQPEELGITKASELVEPLKAGLKALKTDPEWYKTFEPENGWGSYEGLVGFVEQYIEACEANPGAMVEVGR